MLFKVYLVILLQCFKTAFTFEKFYLSNDFVINLGTNGSYSLSVKNVTWLTSSETFLQANKVFHSNRDNSLPYYGRVLMNGTDALGNWQSVTYVYGVQNDPRISMACSVNVYFDLPLVRFRQTFSNGVYDTKTNYDSVSSSFPSFLVRNVLGAKIGYLSFGGMMAGNMEKLIGKWNQFATFINDGMKGGPLVLFSETGDTLVISPMSNFMSASMQHSFSDGGSISFGVMGGVNQIPENYFLDFMVYYSDQGINKAMEGWGAALRKYYNKDDSFLKNDFINNYLGYWTDNGAFYYWNTEPKNNYQDTILDIVTTFNNIDIPFRYMQYDSWWYGGPLDLQGGCSLWDSPSNIFPNGMKYVHSQTKLPAIAHNKYWDQKVLYAKQNGGKYNFLIDSFTLKALPNDQSFWDDLLYNASQWGLLTYEQDWLNHQTIDFTPLLTDINLGRNWLLQMGNSAAKFNITIQYCMSLSRHILQSVEIPSVTQARVTNDYATNWDYGGEQWRIGISSIFASSLGLAPFKDVYWSTETQQNNPYGPKATEPFAELESAISTLSTGPVGPGDCIGCMNKDIIMRCCNDDGLILKPSKAITAIDEQIYAAAFGTSSEKTPFGEIWSTYSEINGLTFGVILGADVKSQFQVTPLNAGFDVENDTVFWQYGKYNEVYPFTYQNNTNPLELDVNCTKKNFCLFYISPVFEISGSRIAFLGEKTKWVPVSSQRVESIERSSNSLTIYINGAYKETSSFLLSINNVPTEVVCNFGITPQLKIFFDGNSLTCN